MVAGTRIGPTKQFTCGSSGVYALSFNRMFKFYHGFERMRGVTHLIAAVCQADVWHITYSRMYHRLTFDSATCQTCLKTSARLLLALGKAIYMPAQGYPRCSGPAWTPTLQFGYVRVVPVCIPWKKLHPEASEAVPLSNHYQPFLTSAKYKHQLRKLMVNYQ